MTNKKQTKHVLNAVRLIVNDGTAEVTHPVPDTEMNKATLGNYANSMLDGSIQFEEGDVLTAQFVKITHYESEHGTPDDDTEEVILELKAKI